ncbi:hypothetical protein ASD64_19605 [Mesorhizobium sp. Root157]|uniref:hypothetical protein n=1 Tax=Mesorhizobium sp. Root157 TaxID=1736477 RepID=UPI0006F3381D|nr:hypothetical protein [Mesorhizobium sp. Root157]KQZ91452.1 hypothetical protein ASD64_19605 [Mesorhizobium sp. Root157]
MTKTLLSRTGISFGALALAAVFAAGAAHSMVGNAGGISDTVLSTTQAQRLFADAPDGVDPTVTGPVSASFKKKQQDTGCAAAIWPDIPAACYPK